MQIPKRPQALQKERNNLASILKSQRRLCDNLVQNANYYRQRRQGAAKAAELAGANAKNASAEMKRHSGNGDLLSAFESAFNLQQSIREEANQWQRAARFAKKYPALEKILLNEAQRAREQTAKTRKSVQALRKKK